MGKIIEPNNKQAIVIFLKMLHHFNFNNCIISRKDIPLGITQIAKELNYSCRYFFDVISVLENNGLCQRMPYGRKKVLIINENIAKEIKQLRGLQEDEQDI